MPTLYQTEAPPSVADRRGATERSVRYLYVTVLVLSLLASIETLYSTYTAFDPAVSFRRDFLQEYLAAWAVHQGLPAYTPVHQLAAQFFGEAMRVFPHATPHPPGLVPLLYPLGGLSYFAAQVVWLVSQLALLLFSCLLVKRRFKLSLGVSAVFFLVLLASNPGYAEMIQGQLGIALAALAVASLVAVERGRHVIAGFCIGVAFSLKFFAAPVLLILLLQRRWTVVMPAACTFLVANGVSWLMLGGADIYAYYAKVLPKSSGWYANDVANISLLALPGKLIGGSRIGVWHEITIPALLPSSPWLYALLLGAVLALGLLTLFRAYRLPAVEGWVLLYCMQLVLSPITWVHGYMVALLLAPWIYTLRGGRPTLLLGLVSVPLLIGDSLAGIEAISTSGVRTLAAYLPTAALLVVIWPLMRRGRVHASASDAIGVERDA